MNFTGKPDRPDPATSGPRLERTTALPVRKTTDGRISSDRPEGKFEAPASDRVLPRRFRGMLTGESAPLSRPVRPVQLLMEPTPVRKSTR